MQVVLTDKLKDYLANDPRDEKPAILISTYYWHGCSSSPEQTVRFVEPNEIPAFKEKGVPYFSTDELDVYITQFWIPENEDAVIELDLENFFSLKTIVAKGLKRPELYF